MGAAAVRRPKRRRDVPTGTVMLAPIPAVPLVRTERLVPAGRVRRERRDGLRVVVVAVTTGWRRGRPNAIASYLF
jgi:hypothetical protein